MDPTPSTQDPSPSTQHLSPILVLNSGSSSLKFSLLQPPDLGVLATGLAERLGSPEAVINFEIQGVKNQKAIPAGAHKIALESIIDQLTEENLLQNGLSAIGHRMVHGGEAFQASTIINDEVLAAVRACNHLAPLHNPANILGVETATDLFPDVPQVAVFDTAFHQSLPPHAYLYAIPFELYTDYGVRRYGFHGTSHRYVTQQASRLLNQPYESLCLISAHLGNGASATAVKNGRSVDTTLGFTPLEGLMMGTRSGDVDPALHLFLHETLGWSLAEITQVLNKKSGLLGLSGLSNDMRTLLQEAEAGHKRAQIAIDLFCYRLAKAIAALAVPLGRLDALIFTGGIGEHAAPIREKVLGQLQILGFICDKYHNLTHGQENQGKITISESTIALVIPTNEERMIAEDCLTAITTHK